MKNAYCFDIELTKIKLSAVFPRMEIQRGEGELEIENQGRLRISKVFSQETGAIGQQTPRIGEHRPKLRELSAGCAKDSDSTPHLFFPHCFLVAESGVQNAAA
jgi:hypothetical protein